MKKRITGILRRGQDGFTLIELLAVMAILAILVAVVAPSVTGTRDASIRAQAQQDAKQVTTAAADFYGDQREAEVRTPHTTAVGAIGVPASGTGSVQQMTSSRWPEKFMTTSNALPSRYEVEFEAVTPATKVVLVTLREEDNATAVTASAFLSYTAIDLAELVDSGYLAKRPAGSDVTTRISLGGTTGTLPNPPIDIHNFLWLFQKETSGAGVANDIRTVTVFQLTATDINEGANTVNLTYKRILGSTTPTLTAVISGRATGTLTFTAHPAERSSVTIGGIVYTFVDLPIELSDPTAVLWGNNAALGDFDRATPSATSARDNLIAAINAASGGSGVVYGIGITVPHPLVSAAAGDTGVTVVVTARTPGTGGNSMITTTAPGMMPDRVTGVTTPNPGFAWGAATLTGGAD